MRLHCSMHLRLSPQLWPAEGAVVDWLEARGIHLREPGSPRRVLSFAVAVAEKHGIGKRHLSNFDCFHYAYAKAMRAPLLTTDALLRETDVETRPLRRRSWPSLRLRFAPSCPCSPLG
ncbi:hypothetical protein GOL82_22180 [Sinorhizobium medicae]|nr:hypothetical protein [Sinorhizobium medicae]MDX0419310.1 hypothetical protein [Sinorhizobium medicae]MDX1033944.1 hypothetical protein [Sinorhizobium medicae]